jgi:hypothetical protein
MKFIKTYQRGLVCGKNEWMVPSQNWCNIPNDTTQEQSYLL